MAIRFWKFWNCVGRICSNMLRRFRILIWILTLVISLLRTFWEYYLSWFTWFWSNPRNFHPRKTQFLSSFSTQRFSKSLCGRQNYIKRCIIQFRIFWYLKSLSQVVCLLKRPRKSFEMNFRYRVSMESGIFWYHPKWILSSTSTNWAT